MSTLSPADIRDWKETVYVVYLKKKSEPDKEMGVYKRRDTAEEVLEQLEEDLMFHHFYIKKEKRGVV